MSGFENMRSNVNQLLHPSIDPSDKHDPTFLGVSHKRKYKTPTPAGSAANSRGPTTGSPYGSYGSYFNNTLNSTMPSGGGTAATKNACATPLPTMIEGSAASVPASRVGAGSTCSATMGGFGAGGIFANMGVSTGGDQWMQHRGKRHDPYGPKHNPSALTQDEKMLDGYEPKGNMISSRFGKGFNRRPHDSIDAERPRLEANAIQSAVQEERNVLVRQRHADRERPLNPLSWTPSQASTYFNTEQSRASNYTQFSRSAQGENTATASDNNVPTTKATAAASAATSQQPPLYPSNAEERAQSKRVFLDHYQTTVGPPSAAVTSSTLDRPSTTIPLSNRVLRYRNEGLAKPKEWGVAQQMKCGDGYLLPEIASTGGFRAAKRSVRPQSVQDTRPW